MYSGVYVLVEKIKIDKDRLDLANLKPTDNDGDQVTGGYIMKIDRPEATDIDGVDYWISPYRPYGKTAKSIFIAPSSQRRFAYSATTHLYQKVYYRFRKCHVQHQLQGSFGWLLSLCGHRIVCGLLHYHRTSRNLDGYRISTFIHKDKDSKVEN